MQDQTTTSNARRPLQISTANYPARRKSPSGSLGDPGTDQSRSDVRSNLRFRRGGFGGRRQLLRFSTMTAVTGQSCNRGRGNPQASTTRWDADAPNDRRSSVRVKSIRHGRRPSPDNRSGRGKLPMPIHSRTRICAIRPF